MKTIYTFDRFSNMGVHVFLLLFVGVLLMGLVRIYPFLHDGIRIIKAFFKKTIQQNFGDWRASDFVSTLSITFIVPIVLAGLLAGCIHIMHLNERDRVDVTLSTSEVVEGVLDGFTYTEEYYNHGDTVVHNCSFTVDGVHFEEVRIQSDPEKIILKDLMSGARFTVYYQTKFDNNLVLQIDMHTSDSIP